MAQKLPIKNPGNKNTYHFAEFLSYTFCLVGIHVIWRASQVHIHILLKWKNNNNKKKTRIIGELKLPDGHLLNGAHNNTEKKLRTQV